MNTNHGTEDRLDARASSQRDDQRPGSVVVRITRPDGSSRKARIAGHFREEHLCSMVDDELCRLEEGESLILHLYNPDTELTHSLRDRWQEALSDDRQVLVREVLGPTGSRQELARQLQRIKERMTGGERVNLAIRSPHIAKAAREQLRKMLLISQEFEHSLLNLSVYGDEHQQQEILGHLEDAGMVRASDYRKQVQRHADRRWKRPWIDIDLPKQKKKAKPRPEDTKTPDEAVSEWIKRVEEERQ
ncbi:MAG: hypothetical protein ACQESR_02230 [Planctomycetota bacterium]